MKLKAWDNYEDGLGVFHPGQQVIAINAPDGSKFKRDHQYVVADYVWKASSNPIAHGKHFWYIGIVGHADGMPYFHPGMFAPLQSQFMEISFSEAIKIEKKLTSIN
jgi:hypothetical protein